MGSGMGSQEDVLRQVAGSDCADATGGWGRPGHVGLAFSREASDRDAAVTLATAQLAQALPGAVLIRVDTA
ncbi:prophage CP4-57 regulatory [Azospirillum brasilense]|nr:prophage CP4-57 regulatory [Azospirillum brasilense]